MKSSPRETESVYQKKNQTNCTPMFMAALLITDTIWEQPRGLSVDERMKEHTKHTHHGVLFGHKEE